MKHNRKTIVLTGCSRGLGRALADFFLDAGHVVCGAARNRALVESQAATCPDGGHYATVDVTSTAAVESWAKAILDEFGAPDLLVNNAATTAANAPLWEVPEEAFAEVVDVNLKGVANVIRAFVPAMIERGSGVIVNFSSGWGRTTAPAVAPYCATKWGIEGLTQAMAQELPRGLAAVALNPGIIDTDMLRSCFGDSAGSYPGPEPWAQVAGPLLLNLGPIHNGRSLDVPGF